MKLLIDNEPAFLSAPPFASGSAPSQKLKGGLMAMSVDAVTDPHSIYEHAGDTPGLALFAEPHADTLVMYREHFRSAAIEIEEAHEGREALAKALARSHDVIVTETRLSGINGYELCTLLRRDSATCTTPIVVLTADAFSRNTERVSKAGADSVLVKPCLPDVLLSEVQRLRRLVKQSADLRSRSDALGNRVAREIARSHRLQQQSDVQRRALSKAFARGNTTTPPLAPPDLHCPSCDQPLEYRYSQIGGVSERHREQWDYYECARGCGAFQYRQRTRKLRNVSSTERVVGVSGSSRRRPCPGNCPRSCRRYSGRQCGLLSRAGSCPERFTCQLRLLSNCKETGACSEFRAA